MKPHEEQVTVELNITQINHPETSFVGCCPDCGKWITAASPVPTLYSLDEVAKLLRISRRSLQNKIYSQKRYKELLDSPIYIFDQAHRKRRFLRGYEIKKLMGRMVVGDI